MGRGVAWFLAGVAASALAGSRQHALAASLSVGAADRQFIPPEPYNWRGAKTHALRTTVWYPAAADAPMIDHDIGPPGSPLFRLGRWGDAAKPAAGRFPLLALSHGTGGSAQIMGWLASALAARGYIVAAVNHPGNNALEDYTAEGFLVWWERARDVSAMIDRLLRDRTFGGRVDPARIGVIGFSLGGYTGIELAGGRTNPDLLLEFCQSPGAEGCSDPPEFPNLFARWHELRATDPAFRRVVAQADRSYRDPRVRGVFAIAPALGPAFIPDSLRDIRVPVAILAGEDDPIVPVRANARQLAGLIPDATLSLLPGGVGHYTFLATCTPAGRQAQPQLCGDAPGVDRAKTHARTVDEAARFFDAVLKPARLK